METYDEGSTVPVVATFRDPFTHALMDPSSVTFELQRILPAPEGTVESYVYQTDAEVTRASLGIFHLAVIPSDVVGPRSTYWCQVTGAGAAVGVKFDKFEVRASPFP